MYLFLLVVNYNDFLAGIVYKNTLYLSNIEYFYYGVCMYLLIYVRIHVKLIAVSLLVDSIQFIA